jgi:hypothetical protein
MPITSAGRIHHAAAMVSLRGAQGAAAISHKKWDAPEGDCFVALRAPRNDRVVGRDPEGNLIPARSARIFMQSWCAPVRYRAALAMT